MKKNRWKSNLDEMQETKLLHIESRGCWFAVWALLAVIIVQLFIIPSEEMAHAMLGEWCVFMCLALYIAIACIKNGIWDRRLKSDLKTNLKASAVAAIVVMAIEMGLSWKMCGMLFPTLFSGVLAGGIVFVICAIIMTLVAKVYEARVKKLENEDAENDEE